MAARCERHYQGPLGIHAIDRGLCALPALAATASRADLVICGSGGLFKDDDRPTNIPFSRATGSETI
jgi:hypothetical protein